MMFGPQRRPATLDPTSARKPGDTLPPMRYQRGDRVQDRRGRTGVVREREAGWLGQDSYRVRWDGSGRERWCGDTDLQRLDDGLVGN